MSVLDIQRPNVKQLASINGEINRMTKIELQNTLSAMNLDIGGNKEVLKRRLKNIYRNQSRSFKGSTSKYYDFLCIIDFEATCDVHNPPNFEHEIIEFPAVLVNTKNAQTVSQFHEFCHPSRKPQLTQFCEQLTGITQKQVDNANTFPVVLKKFEEWLSFHQLGTVYNFAIVTDGPWDMSRFLAGQCDLSKIPFPKYGEKWINIKKTFSNFYRSKMQSITDMLNMVGLDFEGRQHSGIDDTRNIARIVIKLLNEGAHLRINEKISLKSKSSPNQRSVLSVTKDEFKQIWEADQRRKNRKSRSTVENGDMYFNEKLVENPGAIVNNILSEHMATLDMIDESLGDTEQKILAMKRRSYI